MADKGWRYAVFIRGINVGGHRKVPMARLKRLFEELGFTDVRTLLASGNVVFGSSEENRDRLREMIESGLRREFGFPAGVVLRDMAEIRKMVAADPFEGIEATNNSRRFVTLLPRKAEKPPELPYQTPDGSFRILKTTDTAVFSVLTVGGRWADGVNILEREFGREVTTRNWNTILKISRL